MNNFIYYTPTKIYFGKDEELKIGNIINEYGFKKIMIHYGMGSVIKSGLLDRVKKSLKAFKIDFIEFCGVTPNPKLSLVKKGILECLNNNVEMILAIGGGSVIDSAKAIADGVFKDGEVWDFFSKKDVIGKALPVGCILTLSAAGSEMSESCVITNDDTKEKRGVNSIYHILLFAIENPELSYSVDRYQTACGIVDILMHTMERFYSVNDETFLTDNIAIALMKSVIEAGKIAIKDPLNYEARATLMWASSLSHNGLTECGKEYVMPIHQIEHELSGMYDNISHAAGLSALFSGWAKCVYESDIPRFRRFAIEVMNVEESDDFKADAYRGIIALKEYFKMLGMPVSLSELNIKEEVFCDIAYNYTFKKTRVLNDRIVIDYDKCLEILKMAK